MLLSYVKLVKFLKSSHIRVVFPKVIQLCNMKGRFLIIQSVTNRKFIMSIREWMDIEKFVRYSVLMVS